MKGRVLEDNILFTFPTCGVKSRFGEEFVVWDSTACNAIPPFGLQTIRSDILLAARLSEQRATSAKREG